MIESQKSNFERTVLVGVINDSQNEEKLNEFLEELEFLSVTCLLYTSPSPRDATLSRMPSSA